MDWKGNVIASAWSNYGSIRFFIYHHLHLFGFHPAFSSPLINTKLQKAILPQIKCSFYC